MKSLVLIVLTLVLWTGLIGMASTVSMSPATAEAVILNK